MPLGLTVLVNEIKMAVMSGILQKAKEANPHLCWTCEWEDAWKENSRRNPSVTNPQPQVLSWCKQAWFHKLLWSWLLGIPLVQGMGDWWSLVKVSYCWSGNNHQYISHPQCRAYELLIGILSKASIKHKGYGQVHTYIPLNSVLIWSICRGSSLSCCKAPWTTADSSCTWALGVQGRSMAPGSSGTPVCTPSDAQELLSALPA